MSDIERIHKCQFCDKTFVRKSWFLRHMCVKKRKFEETNDIVVQQGYRLYVYWMTAQNMVKRGKVPDFDKFLKSPYKQRIVDVVMFCREHGLSSPYSYIDWVLQYKIPTYKWCNDDIQSLDYYKTFVNAHENAEDQALCTLKEVERWIMENPTQRTAEEFFERLTPGVILTWVRQRKLKPWVLFTYGPIADKWLEDDTYNADVFYRIDDLVNNDYWAEKIADDPDSVSLVTQIMDQVWDFQMSI